MTYQDKCTETLLKAKILLRENDWNFISNNNNILLESKVFPDICAVPCFRTTTTVNKTIDYLMNSLWNETEEDRKKEDPDIIAWSCIQSEPTFRVCTQINKMQWPLWSRETVYVQMKVIENDASWFITFSIDHDAVPLKPTLYVRALIHLSIYKFSIENGQTRVHRMSHIDPSGNIPSSIITLYAGKLCKPLIEWKK